MKLTGRILNKSRGKRVRSLFCIEVLTVSLFYKRSYFHGHLLQGRVVTFSYSLPFSCVSLQTAFFFFFNLIFNLK